jgi:hypothetical protein
MSAAGYSGTPLVKKLGIKPDSQLYIFNAPDEYFNWIHPMPGNVKVKRSLSGEVEFVHLFVTDVKTLKRTLASSKKSIKKDGMIWVSWPKKSAKVETDLDENVVRDIGLNEGLVDVKVCAVSEIWSGLKFVIRLKDR